MILSVYLCLQSYLQPSRILYLSISSLRSQVILLGFVRRFNSGSTNSLITITRLRLIKTMESQQPRRNLRRKIPNLVTDNDPSSSEDTIVEKKSQPAIEKKNSKKTKNAKEVAVEERDIESSVKDNSKKTITVPQNWVELLDNIKEMRSAKDAPVDTMGCERSMETNVAPNVRRYQTLISLMLSSQTKDQVTFAAMQRLQQHGLNVQNILDMDESKIGEIIHPVGFWKKKATYIKKTTQILRDKYDDDIPNTAKELCQLPGVGPKMAYICLNVAWKLNDGIGVDTHVHRIANRLKWTGKKITKTPEQTREALESWLPKDQWQEINILLVGFGQTICTPVNPKCADCLNKKICPSSSAKN